MGRLGSSLRPALYPGFWLRLRQTSTIFGNRQEVPQHSEFPIRLSHDRAKLALVGQTFTQSRARTEGVLQFPTDCPHATSVEADLASARIKSGTGRDYLRKCGKLSEMNEQLDMTDDQWAVFSRLTQGFPHHNQDGVDLSLLRDNLALSPLERLRKLQKEIASLYSLDRARPSRF